MPLKDFKGQVYTVRFVARNNTRRTKMEVVGAETREKLLYLTMRKPSE